MEMKQHTLTIGSKKKSEKIIKYLEMNKNKNTTH